MSMWCGAGEEPVAWGELISIGDLIPQEIENVRKALTQILEAMLCLQNLHFQLFFQSAKQDGSSESVSCLHAMHQ
ncbi:hypothetical protein GOP47_0004341 [Adiantum capillus-veneris]|uniref:Uncharacterized protein n=1 Tax=Adiantum capillus-veneris TaxID=13818 RepID=A0A9D4ZMI1_ADICA|nr:hypothetical protein GOP47_0004341 [Adiantum capillus-veneris]